MVLLELLPPTRSLSGPSAEEARKELVSCKISEPVVSTLSTGHEFEGKRLVSIFLAAFHSLLYRYNPNSKQVKVGLPKRRSSSARQNGPSAMGNAAAEKLNVSTVNFEEAVASAEIALSTDDSEPFESSEHADSAGKGHWQVVSFMSVLEQVDVRSSSGGADVSSDSCEAAFEFSAMPASASGGEPDRPAFDLFLRLSPGRDGSVGAQFEYNSALYDEGSMNRLAQNYAHLLECLSQVPGSADVPIYLVPLLADPEEEAVLDNFSRRRLARALAGQVAVDDTLVDIIERQARRSPDSVAVVDSRRSLTYLELYQRAREVATALLTTPGPRNGNLSDRQPELVGLGLERGCEWVMSMVGVLMAGMGYCPLDPGDPRARLEKVVNQTELRTILTTMECVDGFKWLEEGEAGAKVLLVEDQKGRAVDAKALDLAKPHGASVCYVLYTSSSTGEPKGVVVEHQSVRNTVHALRNTLPKEAPDVRGQLSPMTLASHAIDVYCTFDVGGVLAICERKDLLTDLRGFIEGFKVTGAVVTPGLAALLEPDEVPSLRWLALGGEAVPRALIKKWIDAGRTVVEHYGPMECSIATACQVWRPGEEVGDHTGTPLEGSHVYVLGPHLEPLPIGIPGELCISGVHLAQGYLKRADWTNHAFPENPYCLGKHDQRIYKTGDRGRWLPEGTIQVLGRMDYQVTVRGNRVEPGEIEGAIGRVAGVAGDCVVALREDEPGNQYFAAYMTLTASADPTATIARVRDVLLAELPGYMVPAAYVVMDQLPRTSGGRVDRQLLPKPTRDDFDTVAQKGAMGEALPCRSDEERIVAGVFANVMGIQDPGSLFRNSNFFALGGTSFLATQAVAHAQEAFALPPSSLSVRQFFENPTVEGVASILAVKQKEMFLLPDQQQQKIVQEHLLKRQPAVQGSSLLNGSGQDPSRGTANGGAQLTDEALKLELLMGATGGEWGDVTPQQHHHIAMQVPLSHAQEAMWVVTNIIPRPEAFDITDVWQIQGSVDAQRLEDSLQQMLVRHQSLRTRFYADRTALPARVMATVLDRWTPKWRAGEASGRGPRVAAALTGVLGPVFVRSMHKIISKCVTQIDQDPTIVPFRLAVVDLSQAGRQGQERKWEVRRAIDEARRPFDLKAAQGLLFRGTLIRMSETESVLVFMFSHLIFDEVSASVFYRELPDVYKTGTTAGLSEVATCADYVSWESQWLESGAEKRETAYWSALLGRDPEPLRLKAHMPYKSFVAVPSRGSWLDFTIDSGTRAAIEAVAHGRGASLDMAMLAAFHWLLHIWSNQRRIIVGMPVGRRALGVHQGMLGHTMDMVPIVAEFRPRKSAEDSFWWRRAWAATDISKEATIGLAYPDVLQQVKERVLEALENQSVTLRMIGCEVLSQPDFAKAALVQAYFRFLQPGTNSSPDSFRLGDARAAYDLPLSWSRLGEAALTPVSVNLRQREDGSLKGRLVYQADVLDRAMMEAMMLQYCLVVRAASKSVAEDH